MPRNSRAGSAVLVLAFAMLSPGAFASRGQARTEPGPLHKSLSADEMMALLTAHGATARKVMQAGEPVVFAKTPLGKIEIRFATCAEHPNPCGYFLMTRYKDLALTPDQLNRVNGGVGFAHAHRAPGSRDVTLVFPVSLGDGVDDAYVLRSIGTFDGASEVFEAALKRDLHVPASRIRPVR